MKDGVIEFLLKNHTKWADEIPCFIVNAARLHENISVFTNTLPGEIAYSYKTNPHEGIAKILIDRGCSFLVSSVEEMRRLIRHNGQLSGRLIVQSPSLTEEQVEEMKSNGIKRFSIDSTEQYELLLKSFPSEPIELLVRINTGVDIPRLDFAYGIDTCLGFPLEKADRVVRQLSRVANVKVGIHNHLVSQNTELTAWQHNVNTIYEFVAKLHRDEIRINTIDFGGGFPVRYQKAVPDIKNIVDLLAGTQTRIAELYPDVHYIVEPGRKIVAEAAVLVAQVVHVKEFREQHVAILNCSLYNSSIDTLIVGLYLPVETMIRTHARERRYVIRGSTPDSLDIFAKDVVLPELRSGDYVVFLNAGAYSMSSDFVSLEKPKTLVV